MTPELGQHWQRKFEGAQKIEVKSYSVVWVDPKKVLKPNSNQKIAHRGPPKAKNYPQNYVKIKSMKSKEHRK